MYIEAWPVGEDGYGSVDEDARMHMEVEPGLLTSANNLCQSRLLQTAAHVLTCCLAGLLQSRQSSGGDVTPC